MSEAAGAGAETNEWTGTRADRWVAMWRDLDRQLAPVSELLFAAAMLEPAQRVLDVGCGTGPTTRQAAALVGPAGAVTGVDISPAMLAVARDVAVPAGSAPIDWICADVTSWRPGDEPYDVVLSRFGVMFFQEPAAAFANLLRLTAPGGRLHLAVWAPRTRSPLFDVSLGVVVELRRRWGVPTTVPPVDDGPFSLGDEVVVRRLLEGAGWRDVAVDAHDLRLPVAGGLAPAEAAVASFEFGPTRMVTEDLDDGRRAEAADAIAAAYRDHVDEHGHVVLDATPLLVQARRPA